MVRKLPSYFQAHTMMLLIDQPIKAVLHHLDTLRWIAKWVLELVELDVQYHLKLAIKTQVLVDFILECTITNGESSKAMEVSKGGESSKIEESSTVEETDTRSAPNELWMLHADGSSNTTRAGAELIWASLEGDIARYVLCFEFLATNNETKYETLIVSLKVTGEAGAQYLKVFSDFQLTVGQIKGEYEVSRADNTRTDVLSKLAVLLSTDLENEIYFEVLKASTLEEPIVVQ
ncbi:uncharacterized protein [Elaeis guineensis]|uniref:uncharacterized protein n=1 Tax=Elaeis guineensis var. tenera TaxID=51953 RepID=UPI003C6DAB9A